MLAQEIIDDVRRELDEPVAGFWSNAELLYWINRGQQDFVNKVRGIDGVIQVNTVAGQITYPIPAHIMASKAVFYNDTINGTNNWKRLQPTTLEKLAQEYPGFLNTEVNARAVPGQYTIFQNELYLIRPPKDDGMVVKMFAKMKPLPLTNANQPISIDDTLSDALKSYVLWKAWKKEKELGFADEAKKDYIEMVGQGRRFYNKMIGDFTFSVDINSPDPYTVMGGNLVPGNTYWPF